MLIGNFKYDCKADTYTGDITTLTLHRVGVQFKPVDRNGEHQPDYRIFASSEAGSVEFGAAWKRKSKSDKGQDFLSVVLDDPALSVSLDARMFTEKDPAQLVWSRPSKKKKEKAE